MCGLFGYQFSKRPTKTQSNILAIALAMEMDDRGGDSYGYYCSDTGMHKRGIGRMAHASLRTMAKSSSVIGHTRRATTGIICPDNSHPFRLDSIVGAHNGIVTNHDSLNRQYQRACSVDSQHIFRHLQENRPLGEIEAYGAIAWQWLADPSCMYFGRFNGGELSVVQTDYGIIFASTMHAVKLACKLAGIKGKKRLRIDEDEEYFARNGEVWRSCNQLGFREPSYHRDWRTGTAKLGTQATGMQSLDSLDAADCDKWEYDDKTDKWSTRWQDDLTEEEREFYLKHGIEETPF